MIKRIFSVLMAAAIIAVLIPVSAMAAVEIVDDDNDNFIVRFVGSSNSIETIGIRPGRYACTLRVPSGEQVQYNQGAQ